MPDINHMTTSDGVPDQFLYSLIRAVSLTRVLSRCGTVSRWTRARPRVILWGMVGMGIPLSRFRSWGMLMRVVAMTVVVMLGLRVRWTRMGRGFHCMGVSQRSSWAQSELLWDYRHLHLFLSVQYLLRQVSVPIAASLCNMILLISILTIRKILLATIIMINPHQCSRPWCHRRRQ